MRHLVGAAFSGTIELVIASDTADYDLWVAAGSPAGDVTVNLTIAAGATVYSSAGGAALRVGNSTSNHFSSGSVVKITNNGNVYGKGGNGAADGTGLSGGDALELFSNVSFDNTNGYVFGGGGGGGRGTDLGGSGVWGGGGGGGQGRVAGNGGTPSAGNAGSNGSSSGPGAGGAGQSSGDSSGTGGTGGTWGSAGALGGPGDSGGSSVNGGTTGGAGGRAVHLHGHTITWLGGNNSTHVKGAQS